MKSLLLVVVALAVVATAVPSHAQASPLFAPGLGGVKAAQGCVYVTTPNGGTQLKNTCNYPIRIVVFREGSNTGIFTIASGNTASYGGGNWTYASCQDPWRPVSGSNNHVPDVGDPSYGCIQ